MGNGMNKILPGLYVGNVKDSQDQVQLKANNITHIVAIHDTAREPPAGSASVAATSATGTSSQQAQQLQLLGDGAEGTSEEAAALSNDDFDFHYLCLQAADSPSQNLSQFFSQSNDFIHTARVNGGNVLVHCLAGASRSVTIAVAYIMAVTSLNSREALRAVRGARDIACPNDGFQKQLHDFEGRKLNEERRRLRGKYPRTQFWDDERECRKLLSAYRVRELEVQAEGQRQATICRSGPLLTPPSSPRRRRRTSSPLNSPAHASTGYYATLVGTSSSHLHSRSGSSTSLASSSRPHSSPSSPGHHAAGTPASNQARGSLTRASSTSDGFQSSKLGGGATISTASKASTSSGRPSSARYRSYYGGS
ncbi:dual specificity protein phosphatase 15-like [Varroa destructor]|uniref:Protein-tyrosine-phosphatase n=1 Tax=Varroa destructor TaxID=109461 RepID=A0A7M7KN15_VARDE|nr:dual specificity protein phosphatase 15-like [Varroa destructor]